MDIRSPRNKNRQPLNGPNSTRLIAADAELDFGYAEQFAENTTFHLINKGFLKKKS